MKNRSVVECGLQGESGFSTFQRKGKMMKKNISSKDLAACAKAASTRAVERAQAMNIPYTVQQGRKIVQHKPDGTTRVVETLDKAYVKPAVRRYRVV